MSTTIIKWSGDKAVKFAISENEMKLLEDLQITAECKTEDKENGKTGIKQFKSSKPYKVTLNAMLFASLGVDVKSVALTMAKLAHGGKSGSLYMGKKKLFKPKFVLTKAQISDVDYLANGTWVSCKVALTFEEGKGGSGNDGDSSKKKKKNGNKKYYGYCAWMNGGWKILGSTPSSAALYTLDVTIGGKLYHGYKPTAQPATSTDGQNNTTPTANNPYATSHDNTNGMR